MRILFIDPFNGAAGDMVIGSLLHVGADRAAVVQAMRSVVGEPSIEMVDRCGIMGLKVETRAKPHPRSLEEVLDRVSECDAPDEAKEMAKRVFQRIHRAEVQIHGALEHFHEVGADDAVADVVGSCTALLSLSVDGVAVLPVSLGKGIARGSHGLFPLPAPATLEILRESGLVARASNEERELCTPTGAALLAEFATTDISTIKNARIAAVGYGAGTQNPPHTSNVLRSTLLITGEEEVKDEGVDILETNVDDVTGEVLAFTLNRLIEAGARDAGAIPLVMKKGRSGHLIRVISSPADSRRLSEIMAEELGTLGIRCFPSVHRFIAPRTVERVDVTLDGKSFGIDVKIGWRDGAPFSVKAEFDQVVACARETRSPLRDVKRIAEEAWWARRGEKKR
jgi:uncharacterized protein (TIGR00299 family) protein